MIWDICKDVSRNNYIVMIVLTSWEVTDPLIP